MFTSVQNISQNRQMPRKTVVFSSGMTLANAKPMKIHITYKDITMIFGTLIAILMIFTLWICKPQQQDSTSLPSVPVSQKVASSTIRSAQLLIELSAERLMIK
jgi:hypothetical protein